METLTTKNKIKSAILSTYFLLLLYRDEKHLIGDLPSLSPPVSVHS